MKGIDLCCQQHDVNWTQVKASGKVDFIIPRTGWGVDCDGDGIDYKFLEYVKGAQANGIAVPCVYHFIYVDCLDDAIKNAQCAINAVKKAGLPKSTIIWCDQEEDTVIKAVKHGFNLTTDLQRKVTEMFCDYVLSQGYQTGVYLNQDYIVRVYGRDILNKYDIWLADLEGAPFCDCLYRQYNWYGRISGIPTNVDLDEYIGTHTGRKGNSMGLVDKFINALKTKGNGRYVYYNGAPNSRGCSAYVAECLRDAGIIGANESFHAGSGNRGVLDKAKDRFQKLPFNPSNLKKGDILWSNGHHVAVWAGDPYSSLYEAAPEQTHPRAECGTGVGLHKGHGYYNCGDGTYTWDNIYRIIDPDDVKKEEIVKMDKTYNMTTLAKYMPVIRKGSKGDIVKALQTIMKKYGWYDDAIDGHAGNNTVAGIKLMQTALKVDADGSFGPKSWTAFLS